MEKRMLKILDLALTIMVWPFIIALIFLYDYLKFDGITFIAVFFLYYFIAEQIKIMALDIEEGKKKILLYHNVFSMIFFIAFMLLEHFLDLSSYAALCIMAIWTTSLGVVGLFTNTILLTRGGPDVYDSDSVFCKIANMLIIIGGAFFFLYSLYNIVSYFLFRNL